MGTIASPVQVFIQELELAPHLPSGGPGRAVELTTPRGGKALIVVLLQRVASRFQVLPLLQWHDEAQEEQEELNKGQGGSGCHSSVRSAHLVWADMLGWEGMNEGRQQ